MSQLPVKLLFILKYRENYNEFTTVEDLSNPYSYFSSGLMNSARFVVDMLNDSGVEAKLIQVIDNNCIDREVTAYRPTHVIVEAFWVVPEKFEVLTKLHPDVHWIVRGHSEIPFLSNEGIAADWLSRYVGYPNVSIASNSLTSVHDLKVMIKANNPKWNSYELDSKVMFLPNFYPTTKFDAGHKFSRNKPDVHIACLGAIRPLKNNLLQAIAAIKYADITGQTLFFYINSTRKEQGGDNNLKNIRGLFNHNRHHLVEVSWMNHASLLEYLKTIDISLNVSFTETFNIVAADSTVSGAVVVASPQVYWTSPWCQADPTSTKDIVKTMLRATNPLLCNYLKKSNWKNLRNFGEASRRQWLQLFG